MVNKIKCPKCGSIVFTDDDVLDTYEEEEVGRIVWECLGYCFDCGTRFTYKKIFRFSGYKDIEVYEGGEIIN